MVSRSGRLRHVQRAVRYPLVMAAQFDESVLPITVTPNNAMAGHGLNMTELLGLVTNGLDVVAVQVDHKSTVIVGVVVRTQAGFTVGFRIGCSCGGLDRVDCRAVGRLPREVTAALDRFAIL